MAPSAKRAIEREARLYLFGLAEIKAVVRDPYPIEVRRRQPQYAVVTQHAAEGWLTLNIEPHDVLPDQPKSYYDALPAAIKNYESIGNDDRDKSYYLRMYLSCVRAVEYLKTRADWDGKTIVV